jgi:hypothetical protein
VIVDPDFLDHWRTRMAVDALGGDEMVPLCILRLWGHCQVRKSDHFDMPAAGLKAQCRYTGDAQAFEQVLIDAQFIKRDGLTIYVLGWAEKNASLIAAWSNGSRGGRPKKPMGNPAVTQGEPIENPGETDKSREDKSREEESIPPAAAPAPVKAKKVKTQLREDFAVSDAVKAWALKAGFDRLEEHLDAFKRKAAANGYAYVNWDAAFMEAVREDWAKLRTTRNGSPPPAGHTVPSRAADETARYLAERKEQEKQATLPPPALLAKVRGAVKTEAV